MYLTIIMYFPIEDWLAIFWSQCNVKAIIGWKSTQNGDPLVDVAFFLAMFLQPANYGYDKLQDLDLLMGKSFWSHQALLLIALSFT